MLTWGSKYLLGLSFAGFVGAIAFGLVTGGDLVGVISAGYKGGVGSHLGYTLLLFVSAVTLFLAAVDVTTRGGDAEALAERAGLSSVVALPTLNPVFWPPITAFGIACTLVGLALSTPFLLVGLLVLIVMGFEWVITAWSDRASGDPEVNASIRSRVLGPIEVPMLGLVVFGVIALAASRIFLTLDATQAVIAGSVISAIIFVVATVAAKKELPRSAVSALLVLGAVAILGGGIYGEFNGQRDFHGAEHGSESDDGHGEGEGE